jgi:hypothetical protein
VLHSDQRHFHKDALTRSLLFDMFRNHGEDRNQFHHNSHDALSHCCSGRDLGVDIKVMHEVFDRFEQVDEYVVAGADIL